MSIPLGVHSIHPRLLWRHLLRWSVHILRVKCVGFFLHDSRYFSFCFVHSVILSRCTPCKCTLLYPSSCSRICINWLGHRRSRICKSWHIWLWHGWCWSSKLWHLLYRYLHLWLWLLNLLWHRGRWLHWLRLLFHFRLSTLFIVLFTVCLRHQLATLLTDVVLTGASHLMKSKLGNFYLFLAQRTFFRLWRCLSFYHFISLFSSILCLTKTDSLFDSYLVKLET